MAGDVDDGTWFCSTDRVHVRDLVPGMLIAMRAAEDLARELYLIVSVSPGARHPRVSTPQENLVSIVYMFRSEVRHPGYPHSEAAGVMDVVCHRENVFVNFAKVIR